MTSAGVPVVELVPQRLECWGTSTADDDEGFRTAPSEDVIGYP